MGLGWKLEDIVNFLITNAENDFSTTVAYDVIVFYYKTSRLKVIFATHLCMSMIKSWSAICNRMNEESSPIWSL